MKFWQTLGFIASLVFIPGTQLNMYVHFINPCNFRILDRFKLATATDIWNRLPDFTGRAGTLYYKYNILYVIDIHYEVY